MFIELLILLILLVTYNVYKFFQNFKYWKNKGVPSASSWEQLTDLYHLFGKKRAGHDVAKDNYKKFNGERFYGISEGNRQILVIRDDFHLLRSMMIKDFDHFSKAMGSLLENPHPASHVEEIQMKGITAIDGDEWKTVRSTFSPIFSSGKLKKMMPLIKTLNSKIEDTFSDFAASGEMIELKKEMGKYSMDAIASCGFGVDSQSLQSETDSEFVKHAKAIFDTTPFLFIYFFLVCPLLAKYSTLGSLRKFLVKSGMIPSLHFPNKEANQFFINVVQSAIKQRRETKTRRNDLIDMMIDAVENSKDTDEDDEHANDQFEQDSKVQGLDKSKTKLNEDYVIATAIVLMQAGFDTTALTMSNCLYELTLNPECQRRLQDELSEANIDDYSVLQGLPYLDAVLHETLRVHPVVAMLEKICTKEYKVPGTKNLILKPGDSIRINSIGIMQDPKYFPNPETFDPENFMKERKAERDPLTFTGFNQGPRSCIAMRFALLEMKICLSHLLTNFNFVSCEKTQRNFETATDGFLGGIKGGAWVRCERR